ncbi:hypothetical protein GGR56DRAFT_627666 [Xylariaceae sp. FL0804]|nr:hypothetical protein GGR56DRAFT_627666 [Xylariaceae sp. FL0804]
MRTRLAAFLGSGVVCATSERCVSLCTINRQHALACWCPLHEPPNGGSPCPLTTKLLVAISLSGIVRRVKGRIGRRRSTPAAAPRFQVRKVSIFHYPQIT